MEMAETCNTSADCDVFDAVMTFLDGNDAIDIMGETSDSYCSSQSDTESRDDVSSPLKVAKNAKPMKPTASTPVPARLRTGVRSDKRQRDETIALREEALALQDRIVELRARLLADHGASPVSSFTAGFRPANPKDAAKERCALRAQAWQAITEAQQRRRHAAEEERDRLRALVKEQKLAFRRLRRYLARHVDKAESLVEPDWLLDDTGEEGAPADEQDEDTTELDKLSRTLPTMYLQTGAVLSDSRLDTLVSSLQDLKIQNDQTPNMSIEALDSRVLPFHVAATANAVWAHHLTKARRHEDTTTSEKLEITEHSIRRVFSAAMGSHEIVSKTRGRVETRRYMEANRVVIVESMLLDQIELHGVQIPDFAVRQFQWTVIGAPRNPMLRASGRALCQVELYGVAVPTAKELNPGLVVDDAAGKRDALKTGCVSALHTQFELERQSVENILLAQLLQGGSTMK